MKLSSALLWTVCIGVSVLDSHIRLRNRLIWFLLIWFLYGGFSVNAIHPQKVRPVSQPRWFGILSRLSYLTVFGVKGIQNLAIHRPIVQRETSFHCAKSTARTTPPTQPGPVLRGWSCRALAPQECH